MTTQEGARIDTEYLRQGRPAATFVESYPPDQCSVNTAIAASGVEHSTAIALQAGDVVTNITFVVATQAAVGPTAGYVCLRDSAGALIAQSADFATTARAANTKYTVALATPYTVQAAGIFYIGISFTVDTTVPTVWGKATGNAVMSGAIITSPSSPVVLARSHGSAVGATAPATTATPTTLTTLVYYIVT